MENKDLIEMVCSLCGESLVFNEDMGWVHSTTNSIYKMKCEDCGFVGGNFNRCPRCNGINYIDDHSASPKIENLKEKANA